MRSVFVGGVLVFLLIGIVSADIISVNSGGSKNIVITASKYLEGFFFGENGAPSIWNVVLSSSFGTNFTNENLTVSFDSSDPDGDIVTNISDWRVDGASVNVLNLPMDTRVSEGEIRDYSSYSNNGSLGGGNSSKLPVFNSSCVVGGCYDFDGADDEILVENMGWTPSEFSVSFWIYPKVFSDYNQVVTASWGSFAFHASAGGGLYVGIDTATRFTPTDLPSGTINLNEWQNVVFVFNGSSGLFYKNGNLVSSKPMNSPSQWVNFSIRLGGGVSANSGLIDQVKIYNRALSELQIEKNYQAELAGHNNFDFVYSETVKGEVWQVAMTPNDGKVDGNTVLSNTLQIVNRAPEDPVLNLYSLDGSNETSSDLICNVSILDLDDSFLNMSLIWYRDNVSYLSYNYNNNYANGSEVSFVLGKGNLTTGDEWICSARVYDGASYSAWVNSSMLKIIDNTAPNITIISPEPINYTNLNVTYNISINEDVDVCFYDLDNLGNVSMVSVNSTYFWYNDTNLGPGQHDIWFYCNDTSGNWGSNYTNFTIDNEAAIAILLSDNLSVAVRWNVVNLPVDDLGAIGNNDNLSTDYYVNVSATNTLVDLYVRANGDLQTVGLDILGLGNETFGVSLNDSTVSGVNLSVMNTSYVLIASGIADGEVVYLKFYLDAPAGQAAGVYENQLDFKAVREGQAP